MEPTILVVEDNPTLQKLVSLMAKRRGVETIVVGTCKEAETAVAAEPERFSLILMDWSLPDNTGLYCTKMLRAHLLRNVPIIAMTGHAMPGDREACLAAGMDDYLLKPFSLEEFAGMLNKWMQAQPIPLHPQPNPDNIEGLGA